MRARWLLAVLVAVGGCFQDDPATETPCRPACRDGFTCVFGTCVSLCNPPCGPGTSCMPIDGERGVCVGGAVDAGGDAVAPSDAPAATKDVAPDASDVIAAQEDRAAPSDAAEGDAALTDVVDASASDVVDALVSDAVDARDVAALDVFDAAAVDSSAPIDRPAADVVARDVQTPDAGPCGRASEPCCAGIACFGSALCVNERCEAFTPTSNECTSNRDCPSSLTCVGGRSCGTNPNWRWCYQCLPNTGVGRFGDTCRTYSDCASGVCSFGRCTFACDLSGPGDAQCAGFGVRSGTCAQITYGLPPVSDAGVPRAVQLQGVCELGCARNRDCASGTACIPISDDLLDRVIFICTTTRATAPAGTPCRFGDDCQSGMCIGGANPMGGPACSAPCVDDSDCPSTAPVCSTMRLYTSRGTAIPTRGCLPRRG